MDNISLSQGSVGTVPVGVKVSEYPIERYKASETRRDLITPLHKDAFWIKSHYHEKCGGKRFNFLEEAVKMGLETSVHYGWLIARWESDAAGTKVISNKFVVEALILSQGNYAKFSKKWEINGDLTKKCIQVQCEKGKEVYQTMEFEVMPNIPPPYLSSKELFGILKQHIAANKMYVPLIAAKPMTSEMFLKLMNDGQAPPNPQMEKSFAGSQHVSLPATDMKSGFGGTVLDAGRGAGAALPENTIEVPGSDFTGDLDGGSGPGNAGGGSSQQLDDAAQKANDIADQNLNEDDFDFK